MQLNPVSLDQISSLTHEVLLPTHAKFAPPTFKVIAYIGEYRPGAQGRDDALYIMATAASAHKAWYTDGVVIDLSRLQYEWGDEMEWILNIGQIGAVDCDFPLVIVVGPDCEGALRSLIPGEYEDYCVTCLDDAVTLLDTKRRAYEKCLAAWRAAPAV